MTIAQRYGFFTVVPGIVLLFIIGVALTSTETDDDEVGDAIVAPAAAKLAPESGVRPVPVTVPGAAPDSKPEASAQPARDNRDSVAQLAEIAQQANQQAPADQPGSDKINAKPALNDLESAPETDPEISKLPPVPHDVISDAMNSLKPAGQKCYDILREQSPDAAGKVLLNLVFENEDGMSRVQMSQIDPRSTLLDESLHNCLIEAAGKVELPQSPTKITLFYPFIFTADDSK